MSNPYIGEIRLFAGNFAPVGWAFCDGQLVPISENDTLFNLIGTTYGGDGQSTFALPDLRGRVPMHFGTGAGLSNRPFASPGGAESVALTTQQIPAHTHAVAAATTGQVASPANAVFADATSAQTGVRVYSSAASTGVMRANNVTPAGGSQPHENFQPYLCVNYIISMYGIYPTQT